MTRHFNRQADIATDLLPYLLRMVSPNVSPVIVGGSGGGTSTASVRKASEQQCVARAVQAMAASGVRFDRTKVSSVEDSNAGPSVYGSTQWIYRMEPSLDELGTFETGGKGFGETGRGRTRFAVRQVLEQEWRKEEKKRAEAARMARLGGAVVGAEVDDSDSGVQEAGKIKDAVIVKRDFFGRPIVTPCLGSVGEEHGERSGTAPNASEDRVWVTYHEGFSNAVRKPITLAELMRGL